MAKPGISIPPASVLLAHFVSLWGTIVSRGYWQQQCRAGQQPAQCAFYGVAHKGCGGAVWLSGLRLRRLSLHAIP